MVGLFYQLLILAVVSSVVSSEEVTTKKYSQPFPLDMPVSQECKEKAQAKCNGTCGWAECVATTSETFNGIPPRYVRETVDGFPPRYVGEPLDGFPPRYKVLEPECCPTGHEFRCCEMPENRKYTWVKKNSNEMIKALDEKPECKTKYTPGPAEDIPMGISLSLVKDYCACEISKLHQMMDGMCCSEDEKCGCCWTDPIISKLPQLLFVPKMFGDDKGKECGGATQTCIRKEGWQVSSCCDAGYGLTNGDGKFVSVQTSKWSVPKFSSIGVLGIPIDIILEARGRRFSGSETFSYQHIPRYAVRASNPNTWRIYTFTKDEYLGKNFDPHTLSITTPEVEEALLDWYWVPRWVPPGTGELAERRAFSWIKENTADMVGALDKDQKCKDKPVYCACDPLHFDLIMKGMCCDKSTRCECCQTDPTLSKMEKVMAQDPKTSASCKNEIKANFGKKPTFCQWTEGWNQSAKCCDKHYKLLTPRYAIIEEMSRHHPSCNKRLPWIYSGICAYEWYWVPQSIGGHGG
ncbi:hypothetical protein GPALN_003178 [Globodera pallida]|nr:hypothetical protein GPALN_003178 [Globodera pallida]